MLSDEENAHTWAEEAQRRDTDLDANPDTDAALDASAVLRTARSRLERPDESTQSTSSR